MKMLSACAMVAMVIGTPNTGSSSSGMPPEYTRLAYLESSGTQYVDTGVTMAADSGFAIAYRVVGPQVNLAVCGSRTDAGDTRCMVGSNLNGNLFDTLTYVGWGKNVITGEDQRRDFDIGIARVNYLNSGRAVYRGRSVALADLPQQNRTFCIFGANTHDGILYGSSRIYDVRLSSGTVCIRHYIPVRRNSDAALGLYDAIGGGFLQNEGTGAFVAGPAVDDSSYERLDYLESSGTQYVDTGVLFTDRHGYSLTWQDVGGLPNSNFCGSRSTSGDTRCVTGANGWSVYVGWNTLPVSAAQGISDANVGTAKVNYLNSRQADVRGFQASLEPLEAQTTSFYLFGAHYGYQDDVFCKSRIMAFEMTCDDRVIMSLVPARRKTDGLIGFYDEISGDFFLNEGTAALIAPPMPLPEGFARLSYIESTGTQYINTEIKNTSAVAVDVSVYNAYMNSVQIFGAREAFQSKAMSLSFQSEQGSEGFRACWGSDMKDSLVRKDSWGMGDKFHEISFGYSRYLRVDGSYASDNNQTTARSFSPQEFTTSLDLFAFGLNNNGTPHNQAPSVRIAYLRLHDAGKLVRDFVPVLSLSDSKSGLYDRLSGKFYENKGTGAFLSGPVVEGLEDGDLLADKELGTIALDGASAREVGFDCVKPLGLYRLVFQCRKTGSIVSTVSVQLDGRTLGATVTPSSSGSVTANFDVELPRGAHTLSFAGTSAAELSEVSLYLLRKLPTGMVILLR